jgi:hypothetical protein
LGDLLDLLGHPTCYRPPVAARHLVKSYHFP